MPEGLVTDRLTLRPATLDDADALVALDADPDVVRYITGRPSTPDEVRACLQAGLDAWWMAYENVTEEFVGRLAMSPRGAATYELGYRLRRVFWGRGLATEGSRALIDLAFSELGAERVVAQTMAVNRRSRAVMERCGLVHTRTFHLEWDDPLPGTEQGEVEYQLSRVVWEERRRA